MGGAGPPHQSAATEVVNIGIVGKYVDLRDAYLSIIESLKHGGFAHGAQVKIHWVDFRRPQPPANAEEILSPLDGILIPGGFGVRGVDGKVEAVRYARERGVPFLGICLGLQVAVIEASRNLCGLAGANSSEFDPHTHPTIDLLPSQRENDEMGGSMRLGAQPCLSSLAPSPGAAFCYQAPWWRARVTATVGEESNPAATTTSSQDGRPGLVRQLSQRPPDRDHRIGRPPVLHRRAVTKKLQSRYEGTAPALPRFRRRGADVPPRARGAHRHRQLTFTGDGGTHRADREPIRVRGHRPAPGDRGLARSSPVRGDPPSRESRSTFAPACRRGAGCCWSEQFRPAVRQTLTEIPAGLLDVEGEDALTCASRELFEETGYRHRAIEFLGGYYASPGFTDEYVHLFWARTEAEPEGEPEDGIEVVRMPFTRWSETASRSPRA